MTARLPGVLVAMITIVALAPAVLQGAPGPGRIVAALPTVADVPGAGLNARTAQVLGLDGARAPYPCTDARARGMRATVRWGEWNARGRGRSVRVITFRYPESVTAVTWRRLRSIIAACPRASALRDDDGSRGTAALVVRPTSRTMIRMDVVTRSASGSAAWGRDRVIIYQRVGDAIQKVQVSARVASARDRALAERVARVSRTKYLRAADQPGGVRDVDVAADVDALLARTVPALPAGAKLNVALGDSMASGEAGRWRGNVYWQANWAQSDAYGEQAYWDTPTGESVEGCHRARGAGISVPGTYAINLACSGALTTSMWSTRLLDYGQYKPGVDDSAVNPSTSRRAPGQLTMLARVARQAPIGTIVMSIGGNDLGFGEVMMACIGAFMRPWPFEARCKDDPDVRRRLSDESLAAVARKVEAAIVRVHATMTSAGYANGSWSLIIQGFPRLIAEDSRYPDTYAGRLYAGGCPVHSVDVAWLNEHLPMTATMRAAARRASAATGQPVQVMDLSGVFAGRELCARGAAHVDQIDPEAVTARAERVQMARALPPFGRTEGFHPNQIGQQALQACIRAATAGGTARSGRCEAPRDWAQVDPTGLPLVRFTPE
jgi:hypothetical protein